MNQKELVEVISMRYLKKFNEEMEYQSGIEMLLGKTLWNITINDDRTEIYFSTDDNQSYKMYHSQDCCENVSLDDVVGDLDDLLNEPITIAREDTNNDSEEEPFIFAKDSSDDSWTWTFYNLATKKGHVTIKWYGTSNGYYSERVDFEKIESDDEVS